jgi:SWI/SNF-related matrix-associated actin-dependent regulator of chromatin subfamily A3
MLTRLRQLALHPGLLPPNYVEKLKLAIESEEAAAVAAPSMALSAADKFRLQSLLAQAIEDNEECPICFEVLVDPRITSCSHCYCLAWFVLLHVSRPHVSDFYHNSISEIIQRDAKCPMV